MTYNLRNQVSRVGTAAAQSVVDVDNDTHTDSFFENLFKTCAVTTSTLQQLMYSVRKARSTCKFIGIELMKTVPTSLIAYNASQVHPEFQRMHETFENNLTIFKDAEKTFFEMLRFWVEAPKPDEFWVNPSTVLTQPFEEFNGIATDKFAFQVDSVVEMFRMNSLFAEELIGMACDILSFGEQITALCGSYLKSLLTIHAYVSELENINEKQSCGDSDSDSDSDSDQSSDGGKSDTPVEVPDTTDLDKFIYDALILTTKIRMTVNAVYNRIPMIPNKWSNATLQDICEEPVPAMINRLKTDPKDAEFIAVHNPVTATLLLQLLRSVHLQYAYTIKMWEQNVDLWTHEKVFPVKDDVVSVDQSLALQLHHIDTTIQSYFAQVMSPLEHAYKLDHLHTVLNTSLSMLVVRLHNYNKLFPTLRT